MLKKTAIKKGKTVKVTFYTHKIPETSVAYLVGDFNGWNDTAHRMEKLKDGRFKLTLELETGKEYQFRYRIDGEWHNEWEADRYVANPFGGDNSIIIT